MTAAEYQKLLNINDHAYRARRWALVKFRSSYAPAMARMQARMAARLAFEAYPEMRDLPESSGSIPHTVGE